MCSDFRHSARELWYHKVHQRGARLNKPDQPSQPLRASRALSRPKHRRLPNTRYALVVGVVAHAEGVLGLVQDAVAGTAVDVLVLAAAQLVGDRLAGGLGVVALETAVQVTLVRARLLERHDGVETYRAALSVVSVKVSLIFSCVDLVESGVMCSLASVRERLVNHGSDT